jgi:hypothetical protein
LKILLLCIALTFSAASHAVLIDFDSQPLGPVTSPFIVGDFIFSSPEAGLEIIEQSPGNYALRMEALNIRITMRAINGSNFSFYGADILGDATSYGVTLSYGVSGRTSNNWSRYARDPIGTGDWLDLESVSFVLGASPDPYHTGDIGTAFLTVDNINARVIPIPAAAWLFGSALAGLVWARRKQAT